MKLAPLARLPEILFAIGKAIGSDDSLPNTLATISQLVTESTGANACSVMLADEGRQFLLGKAAYGLARADISEVSFGFGEGVAGWVAENAEGTVIDDVTVDPRFTIHGDSDSHIHSMACVPLLYRENVVGVLTVTSSDPASFSADTLVLMQLIANTIALDIENIRLRRISVTDKLTGAFNREFLDSQLPASLADCKTRREPLSLIMFDVDHFKKVNDTYGHGVGDQVLRTLAHRLRESSRDRDMLVRYGGEEFLLLLPGANLETAIEIANRMRIQLQDNPICAGERALEIRVSAGVAEHNDAETPEAFFGRVDEALYTAKRTGRNRVVAG
ncbi:MAG: sensor domain-containing diguanylate cyclase [Kofleriaceae bacterium]|nr:sensor domain-containing diguanylate cyclase [Kofleriaceae bacterium]